jgi:hypothetical protein
VILLCLLRCVFALLVAVLFDMLLAVFLFRSGSAISVFVAMRVALLPALLFASPLLGYCYVFFIVLFAPRFAILFCFVIFMSFAFLLLRSCSAVSRFVALLFAMLFALLFVLLLVRFLLRSCSAVS